MPYIKVETYFDLDREGLDNFVGEVTVEERRIEGMSDDDLIAQYATLDEKEKIQNLKQSIELAQEVKLGRVDDICQDRLRRIVLTIKMKAIEKTVIKENVDRIGLKILRHDEYESLLDWLRWGLGRNSGHLGGRGWHIQNGGSCLDMELESSILKIIAFLKKHRIFDYVFIRYSDQEGGCVEYAMFGRKSYSGEILPNNNYLLARWFVDRENNSNGGLIKPDKRLRSLEEINRSVQEIRRRKERLEKINHGNMFLRPFRLCFLARGRGQVLTRRKS